MYILQPLLFSISTSVHTIETCGCALFEIIPLHSYQLHEEVRALPFEDLVIFLIQHNNNVSRLIARLLHMQGHC